MQIKEILPEQTLEEGPIKSILDKLKANSKNWDDAGDLFKAFKRYIRTPAQGVDPLVVQQFLLDVGFPPEIIKRAVAEWKKQERITPEQIQTSSGSAKRNIPSTVTGKQIRSFFTIIYAELRREDLLPQLDTDMRVSKDAKTKGRDSKFVDSFDQDRDDIIATAESKFGLKNGGKVSELAQKYTLAQVRKDPQLMQALAIIGYTTLRF